MAVTKIIAVKSTLTRALGYIQDPAKTEGKLLVSSFGCSFETADVEFEHTLSQATMRKGNNLAFHLIQSFEPGESTPEMAHEIGKRLADEVTGGKYEYVLTTHIDKGHIHNHVMFCAASFVDRHKYVSNRKSYAGIRRTSDELCREYGLSVIVPGQESKGKHYAEYIADKSGGGSWKSKLKAAIDTTIAGANDYDDFLRRMEAQGYKMKPGKYVSFRAPGQERFTRAKTLGADYTEDAISGRIVGTYTRTPRPDRNKSPIAVIQQIENIVTEGQRTRNSQWMVIANLKEAAKTMNWLTENDLQDTDKFEAKLAEVNAAFDETEAALKAAEGKLKDMGVLIKHAANYQQTKPIADGLKTAQDKDAYRRAHESELIIHEAAARAIRKTVLPGSKLPSLAELKAEYKSLTGRKDALRSEYGKLKNQAHEFGIIKRNADTILAHAVDRSKAKSRDKTL